MKTLIALCLLVFVNIVEAQEISPQLLELRQQTVAYFAEEPTREEHEIFGILEVLYMFYDTPSGRPQYIAALVYIRLYNGRFAAMWADDSFVNNFQEEVPNEVIRPGIASN